MADSTTNISLIDAAQASNSVTANHLFDAASHAMTFGRHAEACVGLVWGGYGGRWGGVLLPNWTVDLEPSVDNFIVMERLTGAVLLATSSPSEWEDTLTYGRLYKVTAGGSSVTSYEDHRAGSFGVNLSLLPSDLSDAVGDAIGAAGSKTTPVDADELPLADSEDSFNLKSLTWANLAKAIKAPVVQAVTSAATVTPAFGEDLVKITAQAAALVLANPSGTAIQGWGFVIRVKDDGTARVISYGTHYRAIGVSLPATTVIGKTLYLAGIWNSDDTKLDIVAVGQEI